MFPAASAIGTRNGHHLDIYTLSSSSGVTHFENPTQTSAYHYPREHGIKSPSFARATLLGAKTSRLLFLSGTASIVGHNTLFPNNFSQQIGVTLNNIDTLIKHVKDKVAGQQALIEGFKVYLRHVENYQEAKDRIDHYFGEIQTCYLEADICRLDLTVEIETICRL